MKPEKIFMLFVGAIILVLVIATWLFPYSLLSINKSISYQPDSVAVKQYRNDLEAFQDVYEAQPQESLTYERTGNILEIYEQEWLLGKDSMKMDQKELNLISKEVKKARELLLEIAFREEYSQDVKDYLKMSIEASIDLEDYIRDIQASKTYSRKDLRILYHNLHMKFISSFNTYDSFYKEVLREGES